MTTVARSPIEDSGIELSGIELNGIDERGMELSGEELKGMELNGIDERGIELRGIELKGMEERGIDDSGTPAKASVSKVTDDAVEGLLGSMPRFGQLSSSPLSTVHQVVSTSVSVGEEPDDTGVPGRGIELKGMEERGMELSGIDERGELDKPRSPTTMPVPSNLLPATVLART
ncbi:MAG TPA: hypothetical protein VMF65_09625, partial [Acidimicrobiales bacterium]|nr:hypothetical protein [Acidimicrobiales bacterium]